ncbi:hypothetical protein [Endozoicomonas sp. 8E]|uniref:hypothetical protein n=1 Tax=Endozoicomonas sp. 8E TaxID=3035692 RepID=UPI0029390050|nr:hypothetical protein [Endozoicomonas sp. 8E]WOG27091.1 hypothetical protein P6910_21450 [Endozoicomonas sp. 8E]
MSQQWLYATNLLVAYELILTTRNVPLRSAPCSWLPLEAVVTVSWLLKSFWNHDSQLFKPIELQATSILTQGDQLFATITMMLGSEHNPRQNQPAESSGQHTPQATSQPTGYFTHLQYSESGDGNGDPQQHSHTLGLNCFIYPCRGVCEFRPSSDSSDPAEWPSNSIENWPAHTKTTPEQNSCPHLADGRCFSCIGHLDPLNAADSQPISPVGTLDDLSDIEFTFNSGPLFDQQAYDFDNDPIKSFSFLDLVNSGVAFKTNTNRLLNDEVLSQRSLSSNALEFPVINESLDLHGLSQEAGGSLKFTQLPPPMGTSETQPNTTESSQLSQSTALHSQTDAAQAFSNHKSRVLTGQKTCNVTVTGEDGQPRPCGKICKHARSLTDHKRKTHGEQQTCDVIVVGADGKQRPCNRICRNARAVWDHKRRSHSRQQTCDVILIGADGQQQPCNKICKNIQALSDHKRRKHRKQKACSASLVGEVSPQSSCEIVCKNAKSLEKHIRKHLKRKHVDVDRDDDGP